MPWRKGFSSDSSYSKLRPFSFRHLVVESNNGSIVSGGTLVIPSISPKHTKATHSLKEALELINRMPFWTSEFLTLVLVLEGGMLAER